MATSPLNMARGFSNLPVVRQLGLLIGLSASIALGFAVVLWAQDPNYRPLYSHLSSEETSDVLDALQNSGIPYKLDSKSGTVLVPADQLYNARFKAASEGLPKQSGMGFELLEKDQGIGTSRFMETARFRHALEGELSRTISNLSSVKSARVHLAIPKESVFMGDRQTAHASVLLDLSHGQKLDNKQVMAIAKLVSSSVPNMQVKDVTIVDQAGNLLASDLNSNKFAKTKEEFEYRNQIENEYSKRIESILAPLLGASNVRAKVSASIDFTQKEQTQENYTPDSKALRSEQIFNKDDPTKQNVVGGIPGALSNQPPQVKANAAAQQGGDVANARTIQATRNYEVGKIISHSSLPSGNIQRLSVAVVVDNLKEIDPDSGKVTQKPLTTEELDKITTLVKNAIGYDEDRGDRVSVVNIPFVAEAPIEQLPELAFWEQTWFWDIIKSSVAGLFLLILIFTVLRPVLKNLSGKALEAQNLAGNNLLPAAAGGFASPGVAQPAVAMPGQPGAVIPGQPGVAAPGQAQQYMGQAPNSQDQRLDWNGVQQMADAEPQRIAAVMQNWVGDS